MTSTTDQVRDALKWMIEDLNFRRAGTGLDPEPLSPRMQEALHLLEELEGGLVVCVRVGERNPCIEVERIERAIAWLGSVAGRVSEEAQARVCETIGLIGDLDVYCMTAIRAREQERANFERQIAALRRERDLAVAHDFDKGVQDADGNTAHGTETDDQAGQGAQSPEHHAHEGLHPRDGQAGPTGQPV